MIKYLLFFLFIIFSSCATNVVNKMYDVVLIENSEIYFGNENYFSASETIVKETPVKIQAKVSRKGYQKVRYGSRIGYIHSPKYRVKGSRRITTDSIPNYFVTTSTDTSNSTRTTTNKYRPSSGTVHVKGYYRKVGTYVRPHTRRAPRKR